MARIKIYTACHMDSFTPDSDIIVPIQVGTALNKTIFNGMIHDNDGVDNISCLNKRYCELTAQYWAWKNDDSDYVGFMHYRRYFVFSDEHYPTNPFGDVVEKFLDARSLDKYSINDDRISEIVEKYDVIAPEPGGFEDNLSIYEQYRIATCHESRDLDFVLKVIESDYPEMAETAREYVHGTRGYFCNMFVMKKELFKQYCEWLFGILNKFDCECDCSEYDFQKFRVDGYLAERLCGIYLTYLRDVRRVKFKELQRTLFLDVEPKVIRPVFKDANCVLALSSNDYYVPYLSAMLESIKANSKDSNTYDIVVLTRDIHPRNQQIIINQFNGLSNFSIRFVNVSNLMEKYNNLYTRGHFRIETYYRFFIQDIMPDYSKVLYLDSDMVVNRDLADLYATDVTGYYAGVCKDADTAGLYNGFEPNKKKYMDEILKIKNPYEYFQAGTILFNLEEIRKKYSSEDMLKFAVSYNWELLDQDVLNYFFQGHVKYVDMGWNVMMDWNYIRKDKIIALAPANLYYEYLDAREKKYIIHYAGPDKPWNIPYSDLAEYFWRYARKSPYYEILILRMQASEIQRNGVPIPGFSEALNKINGSPPVKKSNQENKNQDSIRALIKQTKKTIAKLIKK